MVRRQIKKNIKPKVSVILPVRNCENFLADAIRSILKQSLPDFELIIIDDGSKDTSLQIVKRFRDKRIILLTNNTPMGVARSLNRGIRIAKGDYIARMDADDIAMPDRLYIQYEYFKKHPEVGVVGSWVQLINADGKSIGYKNLPATNQDIKRLLPFVNPFIHPSVMIRNCLFKQFGTYSLDCEGAEDYELWFKVARNTQFTNLQQVLLQYRMHRNSVSYSETARINIASAKVQFRIVKLYGYPVWHMLIALKCIFSALFPVRITQLIYKRFFGY